MAVEPRVDVKGIDIGQAGDSTSAVDIADDRAEEEEVQEVKEEERAAV